MFNHRKTTHEAIMCCVIDCVLSLNRNYDDMVVPRVMQFEANHPTVTSVADFRVIR